MSRSAPSDLPGLLLVAHPEPEPWPDLLQLLAEQYQIQQVRQLDDLLTTIQGETVDLVLLGAALSAAADPPVCQRLKHHPQYRGMPVVVIGQAAPEQRLQALQQGAIDYLTEPLWTPEAHVRIQNHLATYRLQQRYRHQARTALSSQPPLSLLADLQQRLRRQAEQLHAQNQQLSQEVQERQAAEAALRREQQKSEQLLLNILPRAIVHQLKQLEGSLAERFEEVTILFADIVNFTPLAAQTSPLDLVNWLNQVFSAFDRLTEKHQLEKIKTIGDAYMVVGGLPLPRTDHAEAIMEMAIDMQAVAAAMNRQDGTALQLRIGINTGPVVAGVIGIRKFSYDLWGDAVNLASRMESQGSPGKIQVTEATYRRLQHRYRFEQVGQVQVKGWGEMTTYHYVGRG